MAMAQQNDKQALNVDRDPHKYFKKILGKTVSYDTVKGKQIYTNKMCNSKGKTGKI